MNTPQILQQLVGGIKIPPQIRQMISMIKGARNPQLLLSQLMQTNPQMQQVMEILNQYGGDANKALNELAAQNGIDPKEIYELMKGI